MNRACRRKPRFSLEALETRLTPAAFNPAGAWANAMRARPVAPAFVAIEAASTTPADHAMVQMLFRVRARPILHINVDTPFDPASGVPPKLESPLSVDAAPWIEASPDGSTYRVGANLTFSVTPSTPFDPSAPVIPKSPITRVDAEVEIDIPMRRFDPQNPTVPRGPKIELVGPWKFKFNLVPEDSFRSPRR